MEIIMMFNVLLQVCRGAQVTPVTRDAGCQYEDAPVPMSCVRTATVPGPQIIRPSPIKQGPSSPTSSANNTDQAAFVAAKALQQLHQVIIDCLTAISDTFLLRGNGNASVLLSF